VVEAHAALVNVDPALVVTLKGIVEEAKRTVFAAQASEAGRQQEQAGDQAYPRPPAGEGREAPTALYT
jgi:hypothetical protein